MRLPGTSFMRERSAVRAFEGQDPSFRDLVFYSESSGDWPHLGPVVSELLGSHDRPISYLTSDPADPGLSISDPRFRAFQIGSGTARTVLFARIDCRHFVMTLPDLGNLWLKRSVRPVHYVYLFHSMNSTHTSYRRGAFDNFDTVLSVGPHHVDEIRATEAAYGLPAKELVEHGSAKLDTLLADFGERGAQRRRRDAEEPMVLVAPTWGESSFIEQPGGTEVVRVLLADGFRTTVRLHPMTSRRLPELRDRLRREFASHPLFALEEDMSATDSWFASDAMVSDWSGAATEYAFALGRPVVYVDTPPKRMNPEWDRIGRESFEASVRTLIGRVISPESIGDIGAAVGDLTRDSASVRARAMAARDRMIFNVGSSSVGAADYLVSM